MTFSILINLAVGKIFIVIMGSPKVKFRFWLHICLQNWRSILEKYTMFWWSQCYKVPMWASLVETRTRLALIWCNIRPVSVTPRRNIRLVSVTLSRNIRPVSVRPRRNIRPVSVRPRRNFLWEEPTQIYINFNYLH